MKIEYYHSAFHVYNNGYFRKCAEEQIPKLILDKYKKKVYKIQFYNDFYFKDGGYLFVEGRYSYYPLTVVFYNRKWEVAWIRWKTKPPIKHFRFDIDYIYPAMLPEEGVVYELCNEVPERFKEYIKGKNLYGACPYNLPRAVIKYYCKPGELGMYSAAFADTLRTQVYKQLFQLTGIELTSGWEIVVDTMFPLVVEDGVNYLCVGVVNKFAECSYIGVCWSENISTDSFISTDDVNFKLIDNVPGVYTDGVAKTVEFIKNDGFIYTGTQGDG